MPVNTTHPDYDFALPGWLRARDVLAGEDAVKSAGEKYLPRLDSQSDEEFLAYRKRASFFNATARQGKDACEVARVVFQLLHPPPLLPGGGKGNKMGAALPRVPDDLRSLETGGGVCAQTHIVIAQMRVKYKANPLHARSVLQSNKMRFNSEIAAQ